MVTYINKNTHGKYAGNSSEEKPLEVQNGSVFFEIDTGLYYMFDAENKVWYEQKDNGGGGGSYTLPVATESTLGGIKAPAKTPDQTVPVGIGEDNKLYVAPSGGGGVGQKGIGENAETFNNIAPEKATGKNSHIEGSQSYLKEYQGVTVSNVNAVEQTYEISVDINKDVFPHVMEFYQDGVLKYSFITRGYDNNYKEGPFVVTSYNDISNLVDGIYDIKLISGFALKDRSHVEGNNNIANARECHVEGWNNMATEWIDGNGKKIGDGVAAHVEGRECRAIGRASHAEGRLTKAIGEHSHAEGGPLYSGAEPVKALGKSSHAEGSETTASGDASHAEGYTSHAEGVASHAEGDTSHAEGYASHAEGGGTTASGDGSHAEGYASHAEGYFSHAEGYYTEASGEYQHAQGRYNLPDTEDGTTTGVPKNKYAHVVGNGNDDATRSNAHTLDWEGNSWYQGNVLVGGKDMDSPMAVLASDHIIIKASDSEDRFKITVDKTGAIKAEKVI